MSLVISKVFTYDTDAGNYIQAVEGPAGDNQALEPAVRQAINNFVIGCKQDGIWSAIKASCILAGARTLSGALVPLVGTAPTNPGNVFVQADYDRKTGLVGNGTSKYLNSNRAANADPLNSCHIAVNINSLPSNGSGSIFPAYIGATNNAATAGSFIRGNPANTQTEFLIKAAALQASTRAVGFAGVSRTSSTSAVCRAGGSNTVFSTNSIEVDTSLYVFADNYPNPAARFFTNARMSFYSIGESLDLQKLDARVTALINAFGAAIP